MSSLLIILFLIIVLFLSWSLYFRHWHIGVGVALEFKAKDNSVWIISRLIDSPAGRKGVANYSKVLSINGFPMNFLSKDDFCVWLKNNPSEIGKKEVWELEEQGIIFTTSEERETIFTTVEMVPEMIKTSIPVYGPVRKMPENQYPFVFKQGMFYCNKTGRTVFTTTLADQTYRNIFRI